ncbi:MAG: hypothetical protein EB078_13675 [Proteobacteria bacterium]|nr:hypothetical protein [Pseudomonadota bacterium]NDD05947.1 hypothetical protein [Pseudomonadota bacterium]
MASSGDKIRTCSSSTIAPSLGGAKLSVFTQGRAEHRFELPVSHEPVQYGFYLCTTEGSDQSCRQKKVVDLNDVFTEHIQKLPQAGKELRTLFFQYLFLDDRGFTTFVDIPLGEQKFQQLKSYLKQRSTSKNDLDNAVDMSQSNIKTLQSLPFQFDGTTIKVALPEYQPQMCGNSHQREGK